MLCKHRCAATQEYIVSTYRWDLNQQHVSQEDPLADCLECGFPLSHHMVADYSAVVYNACNAVTTLADKVYMRRNHLDRTCY